MSDQGGRWFEQRKDFVVRQKEDLNDDIPDLWTRCPSCEELLYNEALIENLQVCNLCDHHFIMSAVDRLRSLADEGTIEPKDMDLVSVDSLHFFDSKPYTKRIAAARRKTGLNDAFVAVSAQISGIDVEMGAFEFGFMGGSMGSVVGEVITRCFERAIERKVPAIVVSSSGGARMQEGVLSLMQMAKTSAALTKLRDEARMPYISVLTHPTTGGVAASFAMLGDVILAEPKALVGFAGPRVIQQTIGQELPSGFQRSEYLLDHGMVDQIVPRKNMKRVVSRVLSMLLNRPESDG